jgi:hypothetical protein
MNESTVANFQKVNVKLPEGVTEKNFDHVRADSHPNRHFMYKDFQISIDASQYCQRKYNTQTPLTSYIVGEPQGMYRRLEGRVDGESIEVLIKTWITRIDDLPSTCGNKPAPKLSVLEQRALRSVKKVNAARPVSSVKKVVSLMKAAKVAWQIREAAVLDVVALCNSFGLSLDKFPEYPQEGELHSKPTGEYYSPYCVVSRHIDWLTTGLESAAVDEDCGGVWNYCGPFEDKPNFHVVASALTKDDSVTLTPAQFNLVKQALVKAYIVQVEKVAFTMYELYSYLITCTFFSHLPIGTDPLMWDTLQFAGDGPVSEFEAEAFISLFDGCNEALVNAKLKAQQGGATPAEAEKTVDVKREEIFPARLR